MKIGILSDGIKVTPLLMICSRSKPWTISEAVAVADRVCFNDMNRHSPPRASCFENIVVSTSLKSAGGRRVRRQNDGRWDGVDVVSSVVSV
jgi:hypothetical protein